jgi:hypothetical protein
MSSDDVARLEKYLTREMDISRQAAEKAHNSLHNELTGLRKRVEEIASRLETVEDTHAEELAHEQGKHQIVQLFGRLAVNIVSVTVAVVGAWFVIADHIK